MVTRAKQQKKAKIGYKTRSAHTLDGVETQKVSVRVDILCVCVCTTECVCELLNLQTKMI